MKNMPSLGEQEIEVLTWISQTGKACVREAAQHFEKEKGLARTTILTVMETSSQKGLSRSRKNKMAYFFYSEKVEAKTVLKSRVGDFVEKTLGGSISPLLSYFAENKNITADELNKLHDILKSFEDKKGGR
jgi:predicted transcriptional regulator